MMSIVLIDVHRSTNKSTFECICKPVFKIESVNRGRRLIQIEGAKIQLIKDKE